MGPDRSPDGMMNKMRGWTRQLGHDVLDLLLPATCQLCDAPASPTHDRTLCTRCATEWVLLEPDCFRCGAPAPDRRAPAPEGEGPAPIGTLCQRCEADDPPFERARSLTLYEGCMCLAVQGFKYRGRRTVASYFGQRMAEYLPVLMGDVVYQRVVPVPVHWRRRVWRGYNQTELLALPIARALNIPLELEMKRAHTAQTQARLGQQERQQNIAEVFRVPPAVARRIAGETVLLVDDVYTTGSTVSACARVLRAAGAARVDVVTLARAP